MNSNQRICISKAKDASFPVKLYEILSTPQYQHIISWLPNGQSWRLIRPDIFENEVIPLYFRHRNLSSFMRQVNGWGFLRIKKGFNRNSYYHKCFLRDYPNVYRMMRRSKDKHHCISNNQSSFTPELISPKKCVLLQHQTGANILQYNSIQNDLRNDEEFTQKSKFCGSHDEAKNRGEESQNPFTPKLTTFHDSTKRVNIESHVIQQNINQYMMDIATLDDFSKATKNTAISRLKHIPLDQLQMGNIKRQKSLQVFNNRSLSLHSSNAQAAKQCLLRDIIQLRQENEMIRKRLLTLAGQQSHSNLIL